MPAKPPKDLPHDPDTGEQVRGPSTIYGNWRRGTGVLNNELYIGRLVWNRLRYLKDPDSGKRASRLNPESEWIVKDVPELRIVDDGLWKGEGAPASCERGAQALERGQQPRRSETAPRYLVVCEESLLIGFQGV